MHILAIDIGAVTQDVLLFDSSLAVENCVKMIMPSPTAALAQKIEAATVARRSLLFTGVNMGGGWTKGLLRKHVGAGLGAYATSEAACTFYDDMAEVERLGVTLVSPEEALRLRDVERVQLRDLNLAAVRGALQAFGVEVHFDGIAVAVLDHGAAPPGVSDRVFRFQHLRHVVEQRGELEAFAYLSTELPPHLTRMKAVAQSLDVDVPLLLLDTGPAAALGALEDRELDRHSDLVILNLGNWHSMAFRLHHGSILGLFEHHTRLMNAEKLDGLVVKLNSGVLTNEEVFNDGGHGCVLIGKDSAEPFIVATGPRRSLMATSRLKPYLAAPHGDMMLTGCYGLIRGVASRMETWREEIQAALSG